MTPPATAPPMTQRSPLAGVEKTIRALIRATERPQPNVDETVLGENTRAEEHHVGRYFIIARRTFHLATGILERSLTVTRDERFSVAEAREINAMVKSASKKDPIRAWTVDQRTLYFRWL